MHLRCLSISCHVHMWRLDCRTEMPIQLVENEASQTYLELYYLLPVSVLELTAKTSDVFPSQKKIATFEVKQESTLPPFTIL